MKKEKLYELLDIVIDNYIEKGEPIGSKFLYSLDETTYAPSTLRKYLNILEKEWFLYQPYNSSGRVPTVKWLESYLDWVIEEECYELSKIDFNVDFARNSMRFIVEKLWWVVDGSVVWFLKNDEYYFLWINNLLKDISIANSESIRHIVDFIEQKRLVEILNKKMLRDSEIYYSFIWEHENKIISAMYIRIQVSWYDWVLAVLWPIRLNYKKNVWILKKFMEYYRSGV